MEDSESRRPLHDDDIVSPDRQTDVENKEISSSNERTCKVYKRRWYVLFVFTVTSMVSNMMWNTWGPIQRSCRLVFGWEKWTVLLLSSLGAIGPIMGAFPSTWLMDTKASFGIYSGWSSVLDLAVQPFKIDEKTSGLLGTGGSLAGIVSGIIIARSADIIKRWTKEILVGLLTGTTIMQLIFTLTCSQILPFSQELLFASIICSGLFFNCTIPLLFELIMECVYPVGEGTSAGIGLVLGNTVIFVFDAAFMFPTSNVQWMNWVSVGGIAVCVPLLLAYKSQYRRLDVDTD